MTTEFVKINHHNWNRNLKGMAGEGLPPCAWRSYHTKLSAWSKNLRKNSMRRKNEVIYYLIYLNSQIENFTWYATQTGEVLFILLNCWLATCQRLVKPLWGRSKRADINTSSPPYDTCNAHKISTRQQLQQILNARICIRYWKLKKS